MNEMKPRANRKKKTELLPIPSKKYFSIGEVSKLCVLKSHVLRYWEQEFTQLRPIKRSGNRRYYQEKDVFLIRQIRNLLYDQGFTIDGAKNQLAKIDNNHDTFVHNTKEFLKNIANSLEQMLYDLETEG